MYYYIYDQFLSHKRYDKILAQIESKITDLGIKDRILKMSILKSIPELVTDALRKGASTIVVAGNDQTINQIVNLIAGRDVMLGIIPVENYKLTHLPASQFNPHDKQNSIANFLGIHDSLEACETISARRIETINLGEVNNNYFINSIKILEHDLQIKCDNKFTITPLATNNLIGVYNFAPELEINFKFKKFFNPQDNFLEVIVEPLNKKSLRKIFKSIKGNKQPDSIFRVRKIRITSASEKPGSVIIDNFKVFKTPLDIKVSDKKLSVIVGKDRKF